MKRFLLFFCSAVLCCSLIVVPAFAAETDSYQIEFEDGCGDIGELIPLGTYRVVLYVDGDYIDLEDDVIVIDSYNSYYHLYLLDSSYSLLISFLDSHTCVEYYDHDDAQVFGSVGFVRLGPPNVPDVPEAPVVPNVPKPGSASILSGVTDVFGGVGAWIAGQLGSTTSLFWNGQGLTFLGVLSVSALALAVVLLLIMVVVRFLRFRG